MDLINLLCLIHLYLVIVTLSECKTISIFIKKYNDAGNMKFEYHCNKTILGSSVKPFETYLVKIALYIIELLLL